MVDADKLTVTTAPRKVAQKKEEVKSLRPRMLGLVSCRRAGNENPDGAFIAPLHESP